MLSNIRLINKTLKILEIKKIQIDFLVLICLISGIVHVSYNMALKPMIDGIITRENPDFSYIKVFLALIFIYILVTFIRKVSFSVVNINIEKSLNYKVSEAVSEVEMSYFDLKKEGEIIAVLTKRIPELKKFFDDSLEKIIFTPINFFMTMTGILLIDYKIGIIIIPGVLLSILVDFKYGNRIITSSKQVLKTENKILAYQKEVVEDIENIKMSKNEDYICKKYDKKTEKYLKSLYKMLKDYQIAYIPGLLNEYLPTILLLVAAIFRVSENSISYGTFFSSLSLVTGASLPFSHFLRIITKIKEQRPKLEELLELLETKNKMSENKTDNANSNNKVIELNNVNYTYQNQKNKVLNNVNLSILKNEKVAIIGKTGSGKSTLLKIILGLYKPDGVVEVFNENPQVNIKKMWEKIGYLDNNIYLFNNSVKYNIVLSERKLTSNEEIKLDKISKLLKLEEFLRDNKILTQFGGNMSGGQRLKISIARALFRSSELLIFDEPAASLDEESENILCEILSNIEITTLIVTHRTKILDICDKVYKIDKNSKIVKIKDITEKGGGEYENQI